ncbi:non-ribosomal peptide synthetase [Metabacillus halosaccharovorans]|uniref:non-ribosomal peptide synthetase n=1 Tax=Metabacillus halosaccharovorans TaxID=930124 RepID=UPI001C1F9F46|nr:non-ribosomal peptide synthetase [Metabacillus halosaccharovorans]MBU7592684.1 amino acid adenylation domain-containing protein [Metabacillus halosaccharovorans]
MIHLNDEKGHNYPLSHPQKRIWYNEKLYPDTLIHHICGIGEMKGNIDAKLLIQSIHTVIQKHQAFRLIIAQQSEKTVQSVSNIHDTKINVVDFRRAADRQHSFNQWLQEQKNTPLLLNGQPHYYFVIYQMDDDHWGIFAKLHHFIFDGWSMEILTKEISSNYEKLSKVEPINYIEGTSYIEFINREKKYLGSKRATKDRAYWLNKFQVIPEPIFQFNADQLQAKRKTYSLDSKLTSFIIQWTKKNNCSINDFFVFLVSLSIHKLYGRQKFTIGMPVYNRSGAKEKQTIGMFTSTIPLLFHLDQNTSVLDLLSAVKREIRNSYHHQKYPFDILIQDLQLKKHGYDSLFQVVVNYYPFTPTNQMFSNNFELTEIHPGQQVFPLQIVINEWAENQLSLEFDYQTSVFRETDIDQMSSRLVQLAKLVMENTNSIVRDLSIITEEEKEKMLVSYNQTTRPYPKDKTVVELFEEQVRLNPEMIALSCGTNHWTYEELHNRICQLAGKLARLGIGPESRIGVYGSHSMELIAGIFAILKIGAAYVPIEYTYPAERITEIIEDSSLSCIVINIDLPEEIPFNGHILHVAELENKDETLLIDQHDRQPGPQGLAYMIYTSGSTGRPKGVMIKHSSLTNYCWWANRVYVNEKPEVFALYSPLSFDLTVTSIFTPLIGGHEIRIYKEPKDGFVLFDILQENRVTLLKLTPAHLALLHEQCNKNSSIQTLIVGGENLKVSIAQTVYDRFQGNISIFNEYGPTEATVGCMIHKYDPKTDTGHSVPIGKPADNVQLYVLDEHHQPLPMGSIGELYIAGDGVAKGYWCRDDLTKSHFIENHFLTCKTLYKTGDLVRFNENGLLEYVGRKNHQVKINGYRIELEEIEARLLALSTIRYAYVFSWEMPDGRKQLTAYIVSTEDMDPSVIKASLSSSLPAYMIPVHIISVDEIPLTTNGKIDASKLPIPTGNQEEMSQEAFIFSEKESLLVAALEDVLGVSPIGLDHQFFELGGDSIKAIQLSSRLNTIGYALRTKDILAYPHIGTMAANMKRKEHANEENEQAPIEGELDYSPIYYWFFNQGHQQPEYYNQSVLLRLDKSVQSKDIETAMDVLVQHHDSLRLNLRTDGVFFYNPKHLDEHVQLKTFDLSELTYKQQLHKMVEIGSVLKSSFDLETSLLIKAAIFYLGDQGNRLLITAHHFVVDGISWRILLEDLATILESKKQLLNISLSQKTASFQKWTKQVTEYAASLKTENECYWTKSLEHQDPQLIVRTDGSQQLMKQTATVSQKVSKDVTEKLLLHTNTAYRTEPVDLLLSSLSITMQHMTNNQSILFEMEGHGREEMNNEIDVSRTVGWFTSIYPVLISLPDSELADQIKTVKEQLRQVPNKGFDYLVKRYISKQQLPKTNEQQIIRFNYLGDFNNSETSDLFTLSEEFTGHDLGQRNNFNVLLDVSVMIIEGQLRLSVTYATSQFSEKWISRFMDDWVNKLTEIVDHCLNKQNIEFTPSDFDTVKLDQEDLDLLLMD